MIEMMKNKYFVILAILVIGVCFITALDNKKTAEMDAQNGQTEIVLNK